MSSRSGTKAGQVHVALGCRVTERALTHNFGHVICSNSGRPTAVLINPRKPTEENQF